MEKIVGIRHLTGTYNDRPYDTYHIYAVNDEQQDNVVGTCPVVYKVRAALINQLVSPDQVDKLIGHGIEVYFDAYRNVAKFDLI